MYYREPTGRQLLYPGKTQEAEKDRRRKAVDNTAAVLWKQEVENKAEDGAGLYVSCPPPSSNAYLTWQTHGEYKAPAFGLLVRARLDGLSLAAKMGRREKRL